MQVTVEHLDAFAIEPAEPTEILLNGWEMFAGAGTIAVNDPNGLDLIALHWDDWPSLREAIAAPATENRWTLVTLQKDGKPVGSVGYEFAGLIKLDDLRSWYRAKIGLNDDASAAA